jgi:hypothetical protein
MAIKIHHATLQHPALAVLLEGMGPGAAATSPEKQSNAAQQGKHRPERNPRHKPLAIWQIYLGQRR